MASTVKENVLAGSTPGMSSGRSAGSSALHGEAPVRQQPVALEIPVTLNGARATVGSDKREPFSESTKTVLVFGNGAVIRLSVPVEPGQLVFLTNERTRKEVVCQVVKSKNYSSASGYVELEFTEPVLGFWGLRFPGERAGNSPSAAEPAKTGSVALSGTAALPEVQAGVPKIAAVPSQPPVAADEFKTELKADSRASSKADFLEETSTEALRQEASRLQERLSTLVFNEAPGEAPKASGLGDRKLGDAAAKIFETTAEPATIKAEPVANTETLEGRVARPVAPVKPVPPPVHSTLEAEEIKIPAWLEPLARNASIPAPPEVESKVEPAPVEEPKRIEAADAPIAPVVRKAPSTTKPARQVRSAAPVFSRTLLDESSAKPARAASGGNKSLLIVGIAAAVLVLAAGGTWYVRQFSGSAQNESVTSAAAPVSLRPAASSPASTSTDASFSQPAARGASLEVPSPKPASNMVPETSSSSPAQPKAQPAILSEHIAKTSASNESPKAASKSPQPEAEASKPSLGEIRLAKPKMNRSGRNAPAGVAEPALEASGDPAALNGAAFGGGLLAEGTAQPTAPAAPLAVGGDVKPARLVSSVPPIYPSLAKTQHVSGDVRLDALIDANGRVSSMKVVSGPTLLHQAAMDALRQWKYQPANLDGKAVPMRLTVTIQFRLQ